MASLVDLAELSKAAYDSQGDASFPHRNQTRSWNRARAWRNAVGFHASEFESGGQLVLAFRGTDDLWDGLVDDASLAAGHVPPQLAAALQIAAVSRAALVTGHSLGGALALLVGASHNRQAVTFNAPGVFDSCLRVALLQVSLAAAGRCVNSPAVNVRIEGDPVSSAFTTGAQVGGRDITRSAPACGLDALCRHGIATVIAALRRSPSSFADVY